MRKNLLKVLKAVTASDDINLGDLLEGIVLHAFEGKSPFDDEALTFIDAIQSAYGVELSTADSHRLSA